MSEVEAGKGKKMEITRGGECGKERKVKSGLFVFSETIVEVARN